MKIHSRKKHREYMKRHNLTTVDDMKGTWDRVAKEREAYYKGEHQPTRREWREAIRQTLERTGR